MTLEHADRVEAELASCRDEVRRLRLQLARAISLAHDVDRCLDRGDADGADASLACIISLEGEG